MANCHLPFPASNAWSAALRLTAITLLLTACGAPMSSEEAATLLADQLWSEEIQLQGVCESVDAVRGENLAAALGPESGLSESARRELLAESEANLTALWRALEVDVARCPPEGLLGARLASTPLTPEQRTALGLPASGLVAETCRAHLAERTAALEAMLAMPATPVRAARLYGVLRDAGMDLESAVSDPFAVARRLDFSPAVLYTLIDFSDRLDALTDELAGQFGFAQGLVAVVVRQIVAELLAATSEQLLSELETAGVVSRTSVARGACGLYEQASFRPPTTSRLLRRLILRMRLDPGHAPEVPYPTAVFCDRLSPRSVCEDLAEDLELSALVEANPGAQGARRFEGLTPRLEEPAAATSSLAVPDRSSLLLDAAEHCPSPCRLSDLNQLASLLWVARARGRTESPAAIARHLERIDPVLEGEEGTLTAELERLRQQQADARAVLDAVANILRTGEASAARLRSDLIETLSRLTECHAELERVRLARLDFANRVLQVSPPATCDRAPLLYESTRFQGVRIPGAALCDPTQPLDFDIGTDNLFATCDDAPLDTSLLNRLSSDLTALGPEAVLIVGHADERPIATRACGGRFENNTILSVARAEAVRRSLGEQFRAAGTEGIVLQVTGVGDVDPRVTCGPGGTDDCHRLNRRVTLRLIGAHGLDFDLSCVGR